MKRPDKVLGEPVEGSYQKYLAKARGRPKIENPVTVPSLDRVIDPQPALNGECRGQDNWIPYFNEQRKRMISAPDLYRAVSDQPEILDSLREEFREHWLITSTRLSYNPSDLRARVTHSFGSTVVKPTELEIVIPVYEGITLSQALKSQETVDYLQALFDTKDNADKIAETLKHLSRKIPDRTFLLTLNQSKRRDYPERAVRFFDGGMFNVCGDDFGDDNGRSRGVTVKK